MSDYVELTSSAAVDPPPTNSWTPASLYLCANHHLPIFWLALFTAGDIVPSGTDGSRPRFVKQRLDAIVDVERRLPAVLAAYPQCKGRWANQFVQYLHSTNDTYVHVSPGVGFCDSDTLWAAELRAMLSMFRSNDESATALQPPGWTRYVNAYGAEPKSDRAANAWFYCGSSLEADVLPWEITP